MSMIALLLQASIAAPPPPPPVVVEHFEPASRNALHVLTYRASAAMCGGTPVTPTRVEPVVPFTRHGDGDGSPLAMRFRIDASGRPLSIKGAPTYNGRSSDLMPSFAAWRFEPGEERTGCSITFYPVAEPIADTDKATLLRYLAVGGGYGTQPGAEAIRRLAPPESGCVEAWPQLLVQVTPRFDDLAGEPGTIATAIIAYDIDANGETEDVRVLGDGGHPALDRAGIEAVRQWRYAEGPRRGCVFPYWFSSSETLEAPPPPKGGGPGCPVEKGWQVAPPLNFPDPYARRRIEGWALVAFDVAPWGELGNLRVLHAEPTSQFGDAALALMRRGSKPRSATGASNCRQMVLFKLEHDDED